MQIHYWDGTEALDQLVGCYVTLGNFDGVHRGHAALLDELVRWAKQADKGEAPTVAITFREHPRHVLGDRRPQTLVPFDRRLELIAQHGIDHVVVIPFTRKFSLQTAEEFVENILKRGLGASNILLGWNNFFGHNRRGNLDFLKEHADRYGLVVRGQDPLLVDHAPISSSRIRHAILAGDLDSASALLDRPVSITGEVVRGEQRGRKLGFPTANIRPQHDVIPPPGVYAGCVESIDGEPVWLPALTNIGDRPTFNGEGEEFSRTIEAWIRNFDGDLYGKRLTVLMIKHLRGEKKFDGAASLKQAIQQDVQSLDELIRSGSIPAKAPTRPECADPA